MLGVSHAQRLPRQRLRSSRLVGSYLRRRKLFAETGPGNYGCLRG